MTHRSTLARCGSRGCRVLLCALACAACAIAAACGPDPRLAPVLETRPPDGLSSDAWPPQGWTFALVRPAEGPDLRYGVAGPDGGSPVLQVLYLPDAGAVSEELYPLARSLGDQHVQTWTLEGAGQAGSGRISLPRTLGETHGFGADEDGISALVTRAVRPGAEGAPRLTLAAEGAAAPVALETVSRFALPVSRLVLINPELEAPAAAPAPPWPPTAAADRLASRRAWIAANPELAVGPPGPSWRAAFVALLGRVRQARLEDVETPVVIIVAPGAPPAVVAASERLCARLRRCATVRAAEDRWPGILVAQAPRP